MPSCCPECFNDFYLKQEIEHLSTSLGCCDFCNKQSEFILSANELGKYFRPLMDCYLPLSYSETTSVEKNETIIDKLNFNWNVFSDEIVRTNQCVDLLREILSSQYFLFNLEDFLQEYVVEKEIIDPNEIDKIKWNKFCEEIKYKNRYNTSVSFKEDTLNELLYHMQIKVSNNILFRAVNQHNIDEMIPRNKHGKPEPKKTGNGRANPAGIPYLYLSSTIQTAIAEVRPLITDYISIGRFKQTSDMNIIDLTRVSPFQFYRREYNDNLIPVVNFFLTIVDELSKPINQYIADIEYIPIQYICEVIKIYGADGIKYKSAVSDGINFVIFNESKIKCTYNYLYKVDAIEYEKSKQ